jgi:hypothetical protein
MARVEGNRVYLSKSYQFGPEFIESIEFQEVTAKEMGELPAGNWDGLKIKDLYPIMAMLIGRPQSFIHLLGKKDLEAVLGHTVFLLAN